ncbi:fimbria/pilus outer membrane usher protein [Erwinia sp. LJJL01]|uniref:fimbria/pilus outer membrane usher protein n=1 Tax=Erwinia sp. LJJL01 TaxID=3391839 RepID=UPI001061FC37
MMSPVFRYSVMALAICLATKAGCAADNDSFDQDFMSLPASGLDINTVLNQKSLPPGNYPVTLLINKQDYGQQSLEFKLVGDALVPCVPVSLLREAGVRESALASADGASCINVSRTIEHASVAFNSKKLTLHIMIPQENLDQTAQGYIDPKKWDAGIPALILNYNASGARSVRHSRSTSTSNIYLEGGINLLGFRLRSSASWRKGDSWQTYNTYVERDLPGTLGNVQAGELFTGGDVLDSVPFRGIQAGSVVQMLPDSLQGYSPVIRGMANTQAKVEIFQHGYALYTTWVAPGPFEIRDLNTASGNGDLEVVITEADGTQRRFTQPYATLGNLLRLGTWRYNIAAGEYRASNASYTVTPRFLQASGALGLPYDLTLSSGLIVSNMYQTGVLGIGKSLGSLGALALDMSQSQTRYRERQQSGQSYSLRYGKAFDNGTDLRFAGYRYSTEGYRTFSEAVSERSFIHQYHYTPESRRNRIEATLTQNIGDSSSVYLTGSQQTWWHTPRKTRELQLGFNTMIDWINLGIYASRTTQNGGYSKDRETQVSMMVSIPFGRASFSATLSRDASHSYSENLGLSGTAGEKNQFNYNVNLRNQSRGNASSDYAASAGYLTPWAQLNGGVTAGKDYRSANAAISGSLLAHAGGIELSQRLGDTVGLVNVDRTPDVSLQNSPTSVTNSRGYALVPYLRPYRANRILLDTRNVDNSVDIDGSVQQVYPRQGAVVEVHYRASKNQRLLLQLTRPDGSFVPFGAAVKDTSGRELTLVGQAGQALINLQQEAKQMSVDVSWGAQSDQQCRAEVKANGLPQEDGLIITTAICRH